MNEVNATPNVKLNVNSKKGIDFSICIFLMFFIMMMRGSYLQIEIYIKLALTLIWIFIALISDLKSFIQAVSRNSVGWVCVFLVYIFIMSLLSSSAGIVTSIGAAISYIPIFIGVLMFNYYNVKYPDKKFKRLVLLIIIIWTYYIIKALVFYSNNPHAGRVLASHYDAYGNVALGEPYALAYGSGLIAVYLFGLLYSEVVKNSKIKFVIVILVATIFYLLEETGSTITFIAMLIGLSLSIIINLYRGKRKVTLFRKLFWTIVLIFITILILLNMGNIGKWIIDITSGYDTLLANKFNIIGKKLFYGSNEGSIKERIMLNSISAKTFAKYPVFGYGMNDIRKYANIGEHSEFLDVLARLGIMGALPLFMIYLISIKKERKQNSQFTSWAYVVTFMCMFIFNPFHFAQSCFALFFVIPAIGSVVLKEMSNREK